MTVDTAGTLRERIRARRAKLVDDKPITLALPGYEGVVGARYRKLDWHVSRKIGKLQEKNPDEVDAELKSAVDSLVNATIELVDLTGDEPVGLGVRWSRDVALELFDVDESALPEGTTARDALLAACPDTTGLVLHYAEYSTKIREVSDEIDEELVGESRATSDVA